MAKLLLKNDVKTIGVLRHVSTMLKKASSEQDVLVRIKDKSLYVRGRFTSGSGIIVKMQDVCDNEPGLLVFSLVRFLEFAREVDRNEIIEFNVDGKLTEIKSGDFSGSMPSAVTDESDYGKLKKPKGGVSIKFTSEEFRAVYDEMKHLIVDDSLKPVLGTLRLRSVEDGKFEVVGTDGHRLYKKIVKGSVMDGISGDVLVPFYLLKNVQSFAKNKLKGVVYKVGETKSLCQVSFSTDDISVLITDPGIVVKYPDVEAILDELGTDRFTMIVDIDSMEGFRRVMKTYKKLTRSTNRTIRFDVSKNGDGHVLKCSAVSSDGDVKGKSEFPVLVDGFNGDVFSVGYNGAYLLDYFNNVMNGEAFEVSVDKDDGQLRPGLLGNFDNDSLYMLMPIRLDD